MAIEYDVYAATTLQSLPTSIDTRKFIILSLLTVAIISSNSILQVIFIARGPNVSIFWLKLVMYRSVTSEDLLGTFNGK